MNHLAGHRCPRNEGSLPSPFLQLCPSPDARLVTISGKSLNREKAGALTPDTAWNTVNADTNKPRLPSRKSNWLEASGREMRIREICLWEVITQTGSNNPNTDYVYFHGPLSLRVLQCWMPRVLNALSLVSKRAFLDTVSRGTARGPQMGGMGHRSHLPAQS